MGNACSRDRRWQSEADTVNPYPEVEANAIDDGQFFYCTYCFFLTF